MIRRPPRSTLDRSSAASDVYKRQALKMVEDAEKEGRIKPGGTFIECTSGNTGMGIASVSYTHLRAHETVLDLVCRLLLEKKKTHI